MNPDEYSSTFEKNAMEAAIKIAIVAILGVWTYQIVKPFIMPIIWGIIIAVAVEPFIAKCSDIAGGRRKLVSILFALLVIVALIVPVVKLSASSYDALVPMIKNLQDKGLVIPPPPASVESWPLVGSYISKIWLDASSNIGTVIKQFAPQLKSAAGYLLGSVGGGVKAVLMFIISVVIASALLVSAEKWITVIQRIMRRFAGDRGPEMTALSTATIRGVMLGVVGVAIIQSVASAIGMLVAGVPVAGLWAVLVLVCAVIQLPPILILGPVAVWYFTVADTTPATIFLIYSMIVSSSDGILKPILMGRGVDIPMLVILIGALGGMMLSGIIGLFIGAVVVAISYTLFFAWVHEGNVEELVDGGTKGK
jgi:predicted PurR-regulated permease PerM